MTSVSTWPQPAGLSRPRGESLADLLERVLDKGIVVTGDIVVQLADVELLTLKVRLLICSADTAQRLGLDWWRHDPYFSGRGESPPEDENRRLRERVEELERRLQERRLR
jgi:hypothetical protein